MKKFILFSFIVLVNLTAFATETKESVVTEEEQVKQLPDAELSEENLPNT